MDVEFDIVKYSSPKLETAPNKLIEIILIFEAIWCYTEETFYHLV